MGHFALLVIDMQEHFRQIGPQLLPELNSTIKACREANIPILFTQHGHRNVELDSGVLGQHWGHSEMIKYGSEDWKLLPELDILESDYKIIEKRRYDAFYGTILNDLLRQLKIGTVIIAGVMTNLCCETTARSAFCHDYRVLFLSDGCATCTAQLHNATLANIGYGFGTVMSCSELRQKLNDKFGSEFWINYLQIQ